MALLQGAHCEALLLCFFIGPTADTAEACIAAAALLCTALLPLLLPCLGWKACAVRRCCRHHGSLLSFTWALLSPPPTAALRLQQARACPPACLPQPLPRSVPVDRERRHCGGCGYGKRLPGGAGLLAAVPTMRPENSRDWNRSAGMLYGHLERATGPEAWILPNETAAALPHWVPEATAPPSVNGCSGSHTPV